MALGSRRAARRFAWDGSRVLVTGSSSGIGREVALECARRGAHVVVTGRREHLLDQLADAVVAEGPTRPLVVAADLSERGAAAELAETATAALGGIDVLVNNAGLGLGAAQVRIGDRDEGRAVFETNLWSPLALTAALVPGMLERGRGAIVNVTSSNYVTPWPGFTHYAASKAALATATDVLRLEVARRGVHVVLCVPGLIETAMKAESGLVPGFGRVRQVAPTGRPDVLARLLVEAVERRRPRVVYPRAVAPMFALPGIGRAFMPILSRILVREPDDELVLRAGSSGDEACRAAREEWEARSSPNLV
jgi:short-subunit dehydrogenase